jgi:hypothetical protein
LIIDDCPPLEMSGSSASKVQFQGIGPKLAKQAQRQRCLAHHAAEHFFYCVLHAFTANTNCS